MRFSGGRDYGIVRISGQGAPPDVVVSGPGGDAIATPADPSPGLKSGRFMLFKDAAAHQTIVVIAKPGTSDWTITPQPDSAAIVGVSTADPLPQPAVTAHVSGRGHQRHLSYSVRRIDGQLVRFAEVGGGVEHVLGQTRAAHGVIAFSPRDGRAGTRAIIAQVIENGLPRRQLKVASYTAPPRRVAAKPGRIIARRRPRALAVSWGSSALAASYQVRVRMSDGRRLLFTTKPAARRILVPSVKPTDTATISVRGVTVQRRPGAARTLTARGKRLRKAKA